MLSLPGSPPPPFELAVLGGVLVVAVAVVFVVVRGTDLNVDERLGLTGGGERSFLPSSIRCSKINPMAGARCGVWPSDEVRREVTNSSSLSEDFRPVSNDRRSIVRIVTCLWWESGGGDTISFWVSNARAQE